MTKTREYADTDAVAQVMEQIIKHTGKLIKKEKKICGDHLQKLCALTNSYTRLLLTDAPPDEQGGDRYEDLFAETDEEADNTDAAQSNPGR
jgi:hypothetical protein